MKKIVIMSSTVLSLILAIAASAYAQENKKDNQDHHSQGQDAKDQAKPQQQHGQPQNQDAQQQQAQQQQRQDENRRQEQRIQQQQNQDRQQQHAQQQQQRQDQSRQQQQRGYSQGYPDTRQQQSRQEQHSQQEQHPQRNQEEQRAWQSTWQKHRAGNWQTDHRSWQQRGGYNGYHVPDDRYRGYFGPQHGFRINGLPFMVHGGYPRFQYQGYWITLLDPWPGYWSNNWYDNDDVYIDYSGDGYYMHNRNYPGVGIAISISM